MASPMPAAQTSNPPAAGEVDEYGLQTKFMNLKVHYTFDKEAKVNCLARGSQSLQVQTVPIDETNTIGVVDLRACIHVIAECSPELTSHECDYTIYAVDYSEPDLPQVGQGLLSWVFQSMRPDFGHHQPKMVTGRVTRNILAVFGGGGKETLEVRLKLSETSRIQRSMAYASPPVEQKPIGSIEPTLPPSSVASEWNSLVQPSPQAAQETTRHQGPMQSLPQVHSPSMAPALPQGPPPPLVRQGSFGPSYSQNPPVQQELPRIAPAPLDAQPMPGIPAPSSRPSSRASNRPSRRKPPTGRPRGRPRKKPAEGNTSGYEDGTEGEDAAPPKENEPVKKRAKITKVDRSGAVAFGAEPESLRVAASNSSSLRNFRPLAINNDGVTGSHHLQEIPRAPTPVPNGRLNLVPGRGPSSLKRRESALSQPPTSGFATSDVASRLQSPGIDDDRTPESLAPTPNYPDDSPPDIGSSPPVQQATPYMRSSPPPSSPVLPPMPPMAARETEAPNNDAGDIFGEGEQTLLEELPPQRLTNKAPTQSVPIQVFQLQNGPSGQDLVHVRTYNTPYPTSNTPVPSESSLLPPLNREPSRPQSNGRPTKRKRPQSSSPPDMGPTPPPTTDAVERAMSPTLTSTSAPVQAPTPIPLPPLNYAASSSTPIYAPIPTTAPFLAPGAGGPTPPAPAPESFPAAAAPTPDLSQRRPPPPFINDNLNDPIVQLASTFSSREEVPPPVQQSSRSSQPPQPKSQTSSKPKYPRQLSRSQSAGPLILPSSDPVGPSALSKPPTVPLERPSTMGGGGADIRRPASTGPLVLPMPEPLTELSKEGPMSSAPSAAPEASCPPSDFPPPSSPQRANNKNNGKKHAIRQRLEAAINNGEMPPYCSNCGAIETPTWRKIWIQQRDGIPERCEFSEKPGKITAVEITQCDDEGKPTVHRVIKKSLATTDDKTKWQEALLCNPCGIWLTKCKSHRPADRWDKDASRIGQERRKRGTGRSTSRAKRNRRKDDAPANLTSDAYIPTDAYLPTDAFEPSASSPPNLNEIFSIDTNPSWLENAAENQEAEQYFEAVERAMAISPLPGSTHSRGTGTAQSPIDIDSDFNQAAGSTKRLLFPSPRKDGVPKVLCDVDINVVQMAECRSAENLKGDQENAIASGSNDLEALFNSLAAKERPSTPPPEAKSAPAEPFKTPTRPTPSHRPITRSVSRSMRSAKSTLSPSQLAADRTPTKTPKSMLKLPGSSARRRSPRGHQSHFDNMFTSPIAQNIVQFLSQGNTFSFEDGEVSFSNLAGDNGELLDLSRLLSTDDITPSSPPRHETGALPFDYEDHIIPDWMEGYEG